MVANKTYGWGFVGAGWMACAMAVDLASVPGCSIAAVVSRTSESAEAFGREFGARVFPTLEELLADDGVDIVYVNSPNNLHYPQVKLALQAGKPVLCEKPFTLNAMQLAELIELARSQDLFLMEAMWVRYLPAVVRLRELLADKRIGSVHWMQASFHSKPPRDARNRFFDLNLGGGALLDLGIYPVSFASMVFGGAPLDVKSSAYLGETGVDEHFSAIFEYAGGTHAQVSAGFGGKFTDEIVILGSAGQIRIPRRGGWNLDRMIVEIDGKVKDEKFDLAGNGYGYKAYEVVRCLQAGELESLVMPLNESLSLMKTLDELRAQWGLVFPSE